jgi:hypothetical protein
MVNLPDKQRKQIEFIDDLYEKIVLNKNFTSNKKVTNATSKSLHD